MPAYLKSAVKKSTIVRLKYCPIHRCDRGVSAPRRLPAEAAREDRRDHAERPKVASAGSDRTQSHPEGSEHWAVPVLAVVLVVYALALVVRVISAYGP